MKKNKSVLWGIGIVAAAVIVYFGFVYPPTNEGELSGTVGAVKKHQTEQIQSDDVVIAGENAGTTATTQEVIAAKAELLERASVSDQAAAFQRATRSEQLGLVGRASIKDCAGLWGRASDVEKVDMFGRCDKDFQAATLGRVSIAQADWGRMSKK